MFERVLIPTDFSKSATKVPQCIGQLPGVKDVVLLHVVARDAISRFWDPMTEVKEAQVRLEEEAKKVASMGHNVKTRVEMIMEARAYQVIERVADEEDVSLIAMGARGKGALTSILLGSTSKGVLRYDDTDLLLMRYKDLEDANLGDFCPHIFSRVLFPTDFSEPARAAISYLSRMEGVRDIVLLHVVSRGETEAEVDAMVKDAAATLNAMAAELARDGLNVRALSTRGDPADEIKKVAESEDVSLIAMSSMGKNAPSRFELGSTTMKVAETAERPVMVIRSMWPNV